MSKDILKLEPKELWKNFYSLTQIPRPSKKEEQVIAFVKKFGEDLGLETLVDEVGNVIIRKPATEGMEDRKGVILQSHLDMVPQKNADTNHDFEKDPIDAYIDGEWVTAKGTTLGSDNGMGASAAMAVLESKDLVHGPIEALFTIDEETGMTGAEGLKPGLLNGEILLNMDSEDEGELYIGCAGGVNTNAEAEYKEEKTPEGSAAYTVTVKGLKGGHSGLDINLGRGNANKIINALMSTAAEKYGLKVASVAGGNLRNAIPREAFATVVLPEDKAASFETFVKEFDEIVKDEFEETDGGVVVTTEKADAPAKVMEAGAQANLFKAVANCPNGAIAMSKDLEGIVETSTNLAVVKAENGKIEMASLQRSLTEDGKNKLAEQVRQVLTENGLKAESSGDYPGWNPNPDSPILKEMKEVYNKKFGKVPEVKVIHAGLECGLLGSVYPNWDMISFGPTIRWPHSPDEKVNIATVEKFWDFLVETLKNIQKK
ncbi:MAG: aminoacyl-histidine dipeptidase [Bacteroidales bacterium]|nr:aminoacyl-histidine dipeptidase [Bacteroidales bacterium]